MVYEIYLWLFNSSKASFLSSRLEILAGIARQDATKGIATPQVIADSTEIPVADHQEIEESKEETEDMTMTTATEDLFLGEVFFFFIYI